MTLRRVRAVAQKETLHILRDPRSLGMAIAMPMLLVLLFGYALSLDVDDVPMVVWDQSGTPASRELISRFAGSRYFTVLGRLEGYAAMAQALDRREALLALIVPPDYARQVVHGGPAAIQVIVDGSDASTATLALGYANAIVQGISRDIVVAQLRRAGVRSLPEAVEVRPRIWYNPDLQSRHAIIPGLTAVIMMVIAALLTSLTVAREWERGTMEQLIATPVTGQELILGKLVPYFGVGLLDVALAVLMGEFVFGVPLRGSTALVFGMAAVFLAGALALGLVVSIVARSQLVASQVAMVTTFLPAFLLSGFMYAIANMPAPVQWVTYIVPARYFVTLLKGIYLKGVGLRLLGVEAALLGLFAAATLLLARVTFRKRLT